MITVGELLKIERERRGLTQEQLAARAKVSTASIRRAEKDELEDGKPSMRRLLDFFELDVGKMQLTEGRVLSVELVKVEVHFAPAELKILNAMARERGVSKEEVIEQLVRRAIESCDGDDDVEVNARRAR